MMNPESELIGHHAALIIQQGDTMTTKTYSVPNISCGHCVMTIERELKFVDGLQTVKANQDTKAVLVEVDDEGVLAEVEAMLVEIGYPPSN